MASDRTVTIEALRRGGNMSERDRAIHRAVTEALRRITVEDMRAHSFFGIGSWRQSRNEAGL